jgi:hypothetical protein
MTVVAMFCLGTAISVGLGCQRGAPSPVSNTAPPEPVPPAPALETMAVPAAPAAPPDPGPAQITLPQSPKTAIRRTKRPFTKRQLAWLSRFEFKDFGREDRGTTEEATEFAHTTKAHPRFGVSVRIDSCMTGEPSDNEARPRTVKHVTLAADAPRACVPMRLPEWQARSDELKQFLDKDLVARSDTRFDIGTRNVAGATVIYTYQLGHLYALDDRNHVVSAHSDAYIMYYNDGFNRIRLIASYLDEPVATRNRLLALAPRSHLEKMAVAFMSFYLHAWRAEVANQEDRAGGANATAAASRAQRRRDL